MSTAVVAPGAEPKDAPRPRRAPSRLANLPGRATANLALVLFALASVIPMLWLILAPSKTGAEINRLNPFAFGSFENYAIAWQNLMTFQNGAILQWLWNSVWYTAVIVVISCVTAILGGYALAATMLPFRRSLLILTLVAMVVPPVALVLPVFIEISAMGLYNSPWAIILVGSFYPFGTFLAYIYFSTSIPKELYEAAKIDGCSDLSAFFRIALPLSKGLLGMLAFFSFTAAWANYFLPFVLLSSTATYTLPVGLGILFSATPALNPGVGASSLAIGRPEIALAGLVVALPILIVFLLSSRLLVRGVLAGSVKS